MTWVPVASKIEHCTYVTAHGVTVDLSSIFNPHKDTQFRQGTDGRFHPPFAHQFDETPMQDGAWYRGTRAGLPVIGVPLLVTANDIAELRYRLRLLAQQLNPKHGPGTLTMQTADGYNRYIPAIYEDGFTTDPATSGDEYESLVALNFRGLIPWWTDNVGVNKPITRITTGETFFPILPVRLGSSSVYSLWIENNIGDVEAWPVWTITGPGDTLTLSNETTGNSITLDYVIPEGTGLVIDTYNKTITGPSGLDLFPTLVGDLWSIADGFNTLRVQLGSASDSSAVQLSYSPQFLGV